MKRVINRDGSEEIWPSDEDDATIMHSMLKTGGTVTWTYMQDTSKMQTSPGGGVYFKSEKLQKPKTAEQPKAIKHDEDYEDTKILVDALHKKFNKKENKDV